MSGEPLNVLIVDDSRIFRGVIEEALSHRVDARVVGSVWSGEKALEMARQNPPDLVTLDLEMPGIGGMQTLRALRELSRNFGRSIGVLLISSHTQRGAAVTIEGLEEGAFDFITKPDGPDSRANEESFRQQLFAKLDTFKSSRRIEPRDVISNAAPPVFSKRVATRFRAVVIASSTGGPDALTRLLPQFAPHCPVPMFLVQHLPTGFTQYFASSLSRRCNIPVVEAREGGIAESGVLHVAHGGTHLVLHARDGRITTGFSDAPPENGCRPAADVLFRSAAVAYAGQVLVVVLTGMGTDGAKGAGVLKRAGAHVIAQDEATSIVWGMPGSVVAAGIADQVLPLAEIGPALMSQLGIGR
ncbi:chemotaxis-specific protein-glutamate methyltransferase CheB [Schlesneria paludicola]|uniref:chemotaxis-specific protein-glutamate methyltransferase CheB n=1 Tax=Schlesneria paludicola TaxID=360056 RepID=UPI00029A1CE3|nr:chemotaxis-specific protein-glutamate methyltransferase CheB [Schlesneria paludicola]